MRRARSLVNPVVRFLATVATLTTIQVVADVHIGGALRVASIVSLQWWAGAVLLRAAWRGRAVTALEFVSLGCVLGMSLTLLTDQLVVTFTGAGWGWLLPVVAALGLAARRGDRAPRVALRDWLWIAVATGILLGVGWYWPMPVAVCGAVLLACTEPAVAARLGSRLRRCLQTVAAAGVLPALWWGLAARPATWWIEDSDYGFFEAIGRAFARDGAWANPIASGYPIRYHWFVYGWFGMIERVADTPNWVVMSRSGLLLGSLAAVAVLLALLRRMLASRAVAVAALVGIASFDTFTSWGSGFRLGLVSAASQLVGFAWLFAVVLVVLLRSHVGLTTWPLSALLMACATGAKISHGVVAAAGIGAATLAAAARERTARPRLAPDAAAAAVAFLLAFVVVHLGAGNLRVAFMRFPLSLQGELVDYPGRPTVLAGVVMLLGLAGTAVLAVLLSLGSRVGRSEPATWFAVGALAAGIAVSVSTESVFGSQLYFAHSAVAVALPLVAVQLSRSGAPRLTRSALAVVVAGGVVAAVATRAIPSLDSGSPTAIVLRLSRAATWLVPAVAVVVLVAIGVVRARAAGRVVLLGLAVAGAATGLVNWADSLRSRYPDVFLAQPESRVGSQELRDAAAWIARETPRATILATNETSFLAATLSRRDALLVAEYLAARHTRETPERDAEFEDRTMLQRDFAAAPTEALRERLVAKGAEWFLVRLEPGTDWSSDVGTVRYRNAGYVVVELTAP